MRQLRKMMFCLCIFSATFVNAGGIISDDAIETRKAYIYPDGHEVTRARLFTHARFVATKYKYDATGYIDGIAHDACVLEYGASYTVADWNDIVGFYSASTEPSIREFYINLILTFRASDLVFFLI